ncbi:MAG TPA: peptidoglycan-binding protein [Baekduia sp.]|nr:peptidoglycan-binding protein [Baekduia sp.]
MSPFRSSVVGLAASFAAATLLFVPALAQADAQVAGSRSAHRTTLQRGDHGKAVRRIQRLLTKAGFTTGRDGEFGPATARVVRAFQRAARLEVTGVVDRKTFVALRHATDGSVARNVSGGFNLHSLGQRAEHLGDRIPLRRGMSGHDVRVLQDYLRRAGFSTSVDGEFGRGTARSVRRFERDQEIAKDGVVDAADIAALRSLVEGDQTTPAQSRTLQEQPGAKATIDADGFAVAPADAPQAVKDIIAAGNEIAKKPYIYGGGHGSWKDRGYDCSGSVSYALHGAGLLDASMPSGSFESWGERGRGDWVTLYANGGHMYMVVAGIRFDTSGRSQDGTRWHADMRSGSGFVAVHPKGL